MADRNGMTLDEFVTLAAEAKRRLPAGTKLVKNDVGNLAAVLNGDYIGWVDLMFAEVDVMGDDTYDVR